MPRFGNVADNAQRLIAEARGQMSAITGKAHAVLDKAQYVADAAQRTVGQGYVQGAVEFELRQPEPQAGLLERFCYHLVKNLVVRGTMYLKLPTGDGGTDEKV
jgi:hypothetical protein